MSDYLVLFVTVPTVELAENIARSLVGDRLVACVNIVPSVRSFYRWQGTVRDDQELLLVIKTRREHFDVVRERIVELHDYEVPEVVALPVVAGHHPYLRWIDDSVGQPPYADDCNRSRE